MTDMNPSLLNASPLRLLRCSLVAALLVGTLSLAGCGDDEPDALAKVGEREVSDAQFEAYLQFKRMGLRTQEQSNAALEEYLSREALAQAIETTDELDSALIEAELAEFRKEMLISRYFQAYLDEAVSQEAIENYYNSHADEYEERKVHVAHILVRTNRRMNEEQRRAALTKAQEAYSRLQAGDDFAEIVTNYSEDRVSVGRGGDLGFIREGTIDARFSERAFALEVGAHSEPFETPFGYHIVKVVEEPQVIRRPLEAVQGDIRYQLRNEAKEAEIERLRNSVTVETREGGYAPTPPGGQPAADPSEEAEEAEAE